MQARPLTPAERMADRFDQAYTLNFTTVARVRGPLSAEELEAALRCLERRHPLLRARIVRSDSDVSFAPGEAREIPLFVEDAGEDDIVGRAARTIAHAAWEDDGPRAELLWVRHGTERSTLMLRFHHVVSDGSSGILAMRDLLSFVADPRLDRVVSLPSPGQDAFFPESHAALRSAFLEGLARGEKAAPPREALRVGEWGDAPIEARRPAVRRIRFTEAESDAIARRAKQDGATVHGALLGAISLAIAQETGRSALQRLAHPVDLRRHLRELEPHGTPIGEVVGYYVSAVTTEHPVEGTESLPALARVITEAVRSAKQAGEPLLSAPVRGPLLVERTRALGLDEFRALAEQKVFLNTFSLSNLGPLERLGVIPRVGRLEVEDLFFVAASSVMSQLGGTAVSFGGRIALQLGCVEPMVSRTVLERLVERVEALLRGYARESVA